MSFEVRFHKSQDDEGGDSFDLGSASDLSYLSNWLDGPPKKRYPTLAEFAIEGQVKNTKALAADIDKAITDKVAKPKGIIEFLSHLEELVGDGSVDEWATIEE